MYLPVPQEQGWGPAVANNFSILDTAVYDLQQATNPNAYVPTGCQIIGADFTPPTGWLLCDGSAVSRATYAPLFAKIGTRYGVGNGSTTFNLPNKTGKVVVGADPTGVDTDYLLGATGGAEEVTLGATQIPAHKHDASSDTAGAHTHTYDRTGTTSTSGSGGSYYASTLIINTNTSSGGGHSHAITTEDAGGGLAHENRMPYVAEPWWIKT